jgi:Cu2+-exporting ATPase
MQSEDLPWDKEKQSSLEPIYQQGHSVVMVVVNNDIVGAIEIKPTIRHEIPEKLGMAGFFAEVLPEGKSEIVSTLQKQGRKVCFIDDGINDTIAMKQADVSISLQGASTIATDTADIILMNGELKYIDQLFNIANNLNHIMKKSTIMVVMPAAMILLGSVLPRSLYHCSSLMKQDTLKGK